MNDLMRYLFSQLRIKNMPVDEFRMAEINLQN